MELSLNDDARLRELSYHGLLLMPKYDPDGPSRLARKMLGEPPETKRNLPDQLPTGRARSADAELRECDEAYKKLKPKRGFTFGSGA